MGAGGAPQAAPVVVPARKRRLRKPIRAYLEAHAFLGLLVLALVFFSVWPKTSAVFPTTANLQILFGSSTVAAIAALGSLIPLVCNEWDLSIGATAGLSSVFVAVALTNGTSPFLAIALGIGIGLAVGIVNAVLVTRLNVNAVITTLGMSIILAGIISLKTGGVTVAGSIPVAVTNFGTLSWFGIPRSVVALAVVAAIAYYVLDYTPYGRYLYALGSNRSAARLTGIRIKLVVGTTFVIAGALCGAAGVLQVARAGGANPHLADSILLPALAAAFLSAAAVRPGRYNVGGVLVSVYFLAVLNNGLNLAGAPEYVSNFVNGGALIVGVGVAARLGGRREA
ncbi:ABC transporter permease [Marmoricola sp. URHB0036]|uniref:ABC transporter permease n=1 Tax=Marmoricola sp. URHB0036 TaxID=1298863 RepID=UPI0018CB2F22|nr:ABC transporter permease [Marmoricola sp. URHB0036]